MTTTTPRLLQGSSDDAHTGRVSRATFTGVVMTATGGPLYLSSSLIPGLLGDAAPSAGLVVLLAAVMFLPTLVVWLRYSDDIVSNGGLFSFVECAVGRKVALVQAALWLISYVLYLGYTVAYICYDVLPVVFPEVVPYRQLLQISIPLALAALVLAPVRVCLPTLAIVGAAQVALLALATAVSFGDVGAPASSFIGHGDPAGVALTGANIGLLFICASLPLFLAAEVRGGAGAVRTGLKTGWGIVAALAVLATVPLAQTATRLRSTEVAGVALAQHAGSPLLADAIGIGTALSVAGVLAAEFLAITRLVHAVTRQPVPRVSRILSVGFVAASAACLINPTRIYDSLLTPSLVALWLAQLIVVAAYPWFAAKRTGLRSNDLLIAAGGAVLMMYGLYTATIGSLAT